MTALTCLFAHLRNCEGPDNNRVVYRNAAGLALRVEQPWCWGHAAKQVGRVAWYPDATRIYFEPITADVLLVDVVAGLPRLAVADGAVRVL